MALLALIIYLAAATFQLGLPGINYDEVLDAVPAMQAVLSQPIDAAGSLHLFGRDWPLMTMPYIGGTTSYLLMPGFALFGVSPIVLRLTTIAVGLVSLVLIWGFLRDFFDERVAGLSLLLLAVNPTYVFWSRMGAWVAQPLLPIAVVALWMLYRWYRTGKQSSLVLAAFFLGFGLTTKLLFLWMWVALAIAWFVLSPWLDPTGGLRGWRRWLWPARRVTPRGLVLSALALLISLSPIILYNLQGGGVTFDFFQGTILSQETARIATLESLRSTPRVASADLATLLNGSWFAARYGTTATNRLAVPALAAALAIIVWLSLRRRLSYSPKRPALLFILLASILTMSAATSISQGAEHLVILWPIPQALVAVAVFSLVDVAARRPERQRLAAWALIAVAVVGLMTAEASTTVRHHRALARTGGVGHFSDAIYALAADLETTKPSRLIALDWGFKRNLQFLSKGQLTPEEWFAYGPPGEETESYLEQLVDQPGLVYLFHAPRYTAFLGHWELFERIAYRHGLAPVVWKGYRQRDGEPVFQAVRLEPTPPLAELPGTASQLNTRVGDLRLLGYDLPHGSIVPGETLQATLYWQAQSPQDRSYKVFVHLVDDTGKLWSQHDAIPARLGIPNHGLAAG